MGGKYILNLNLLAILKMKKQFSKTLFLIFLTQFFIGIHCIGQVGPAKLIKKYSFSNDIGNNVHCSLQDKAGNIWFGTTGDGLYKYNGKYFTQYTTDSGLNHNTINHILEDRKGNLWIGTEAGLLKYNGSTFEEITIPLPKNTPPNKYHFTHDVFSMIQDRSGKLWFATIDGVFVYDGKHFKPFKISEQSAGYKNNNHNVEYILEDKQGAIWFGGRVNKGVYRYKNNTLINLKIDGDNWAWPVLQDKNGQIWFSNWTGAYRYDGKKFAKLENVPQGAVTRIIENRKGNIWLGGDIGLCKFDGKGVTCFSTKDGLKNGDVWSILEDKKGAIWVGTRHTMLHHFNGVSFTVFSE